MIPAWLGIAGGATGVISDPYWSFVVQMAHFEDATSSSTYLNSATGKGTTIANSANTATSASQFKWPPRSLSVINAANSGARAPTSTDYAFGTSDWTLEFWLYPVSLSVRRDSTRIYFDMRNSSLTAAWVVTLASGNNSTGNLNFFANGANRITSTSVLTAAVWQHVALCRNSGTTRLFVSGSQVGSDFTDSNTYVSVPLSVSFAGNSAGSCDNFFQDLRITNGVGRYTTNFSVPTAPFPNQ